jgi:hypothetical protein
MALHSGPFVHWNLHPDPAAEARRLLDECKAAEPYDAPAQARFGRLISTAAVGVVRTAPDGSVESSRPPPCPGCRRTMRLVGRESRAAHASTDILTFECECGQITTAMMNQ